MAAATITNMFQIDADTLNHCLDEVEDFTNRLRTVYDDLKKYKTEKASMKPQKQEKEMRKLIAKIPPGDRFVDIFKKFKLAINLAANLESHMTSPKPSELCILLHKALRLVLDVCKMAHGDIAPRVVSPLFTSAGKALNETSLPEDLKETLHGLGPAWNQSQIEYSQGPVAVFAPVFPDGFEPYRDRRDEQVQHPQRFAEKPTSQASSSGSNSADIESEKQRIQRQEELLLLEQKELETKQKKIALERQELEDAQRNLIQREARSVSAQASPALARNDPEKKSQAASTGHGSTAKEVIYIVQPPVDYASSKDLSKYVSENIPPRQRSFLAELLRSNRRIAQVMFTLAGDKPEQLSVSKHEYLEVLDSQKQWWKCRNAAGKVGYTPSTILSSLDPVDFGEQNREPDVDEAPQPTPPPTRSGHRSYTPPEPNRYPGEQIEFQNTERFVQNLERFAQAERLAREERYAQPERSPPPRPMPKPVYVRPPREGYLDSHDNDRYLWQGEKLREDPHVPQYIKDRIVKQGYSYLTPSP